MDNIITIWIILVIGYVFLCLTLMFVMYLATKPKIDKAMVDFSKEHDHPINNPNKEVKE